MLGRERYMQQQKCEFVKPSLHIFAKMILWYSMIYIWCTFLVGWCDGFTQQWTVRKLVNYGYVRNTRYCSGVWAFQKVGKIHHPEIVEV